MIPVFVYQFQGTAVNRFGGRSLLVQLVWELQLHDNAAMGAIKGGIDLTPANMHLHTQNSNGEIKFQMDPAMLKQLQNAPGFVPVIINIQPLGSLRDFLGLGMKYN